MIIDPWPATIVMKTCTTCESPFFDGRTVGFRLLRVHSDWFLLLVLSFASLGYGGAGEDRWYSCACVCG